MLATHYDGFAAPTPYAGKDLRRTDRERVVDLDFSDVEREPHISFGWVMLALVCFWGSLAALVWAWAS